MNTIRSAGPNDADDFRVVGYLYAEVQARPATKVRLETSRPYVDQMAVLCADRQHGVGTALLPAGAAFGSACGLAHLVLDVCAFDESARVFYQAQAFPSCARSCGVPLTQAPVPFSIRRQNERCNSQRSY